MRGAILYEAPSVIDGEPIVAIVTGLAGDSRNSKTGGIPQLWILRADLPPMDAANQGKDVSVCGDCKHRGSMQDRACYVQVGWAPHAIYRARVQGVYPKAPLCILRGRTVRVGAYGDPAALPLTFLEDLYGRAGKILSYTHAWRQSPELKDQCLASVEGLEEYQEAKDLGWRTTRVFSPREPGRQKSEVQCPATTLLGHQKNITCKKCLLCSPGRTRKDILIPLHGSKAMREAYHRARTGRRIPEQVGLFF